MDRVLIPSFVTEKLQLNLGLTAILALMFVLQMVTEDMPKINGMNKLCEFSQDWKVEEENKEGIEAKVQTAVMRASVSPVPSRAAD